MPRAGLRLALAGLFALILVTAAGAAYLAFQKPDYRRLNVVQRYLVAGILLKWFKAIDALPKDQRVLVDYNRLMSMLNFAERSLAEQIFAVDPQDLGFKGPFQSREKPANLVRVEPQKYRLRGEWQTTGVQHCPAHAYQDYLNLMAAMRRDLGKTLLIESAYRSPGRQAFGFLLYLVKTHDYSLEKTARLNALPGYSEHNHPGTTAIDFINEDGINGDEPGQRAADFENLPEYQWLRQHAHKFNFHLSYPRDNALGITFEPWHWHWEKAP